LTTFYSPRFETPRNLEGQIPVFISPRNSVAQLYRQALGSLFVASYYSQRNGAEHGSEPESESLYDWQFTSSKFCLGDKPLENHDQYFFQLNNCCYSHYVTSFLARGWVCRLQLLLALASTVILRSKSRGPHYHILLSRIRDSPNPECQAPFLYLPGTGWPSYTSRHWVFRTGSPQLSFL
jgi:hypothetical protein